MKLIVEKQQASLRELIFVFFKLGTLSFGGPAAHIALMKRDIVTQRKWLTEAQFLDYLGATNLIPGPNSTEMAIHIGHHQRGLIGLFVAGTSFIIPAMLMVWAIAWAYVRYGSLPEVLGILYGIKPAVIAIIIQALWYLGRTAIKSIFLGILGIAALGASAIGWNEVIIILLAGTAAMAFTQMKSRLKSHHYTFFLGLHLVLSSLTFITKTWAATAIGIKAPVSLLKLFLIFLKIGSVLFGSGYVLLAFLRADFVENLHWLTEKQLLDAVAVGQLTPGPVFTTATFVGYLLAGNKGAVLATMGIFLPAFFFVAISTPLISRLRKSLLAGAFLDGINIASLALMALVTWQLGSASLIDMTTVGIGLISAVLLIRFQVNSIWPILIGGFMGYLHLLDR